MIEEIGGYLELELYDSPFLHENALAFNTGRNCLAYLINKRKIKKIALPIFSCDVIKKVCMKYGVEIRWYTIDKHFQPCIDKIDTDEWLYVINYYGLLDSKYMSALKERHINVIFDQAQAYYQVPVENSDNIYTCRKYFGVPDGAFLYTNLCDNDVIEASESRNDVGYLLGRFETNAADYYAEYVNHEKQLDVEPIKRMSRLTKNWLCAIDYEKVKRIRNNNYEYLNKHLQKYNKIEVAHVDGPYMYPFMAENAHELRKRLIEQKIYVPVLWPNVLEDAETGTWDYRLADEILPLPVDQRYNARHMEKIVTSIIKLGGLG